MCANAFSQDKLSSLPEQQRDSILVEIAQNLLKEKYPKWYRKNIIPEVTRGTYVDIEKTKHFHNMPNDVKTGDVFYRIKLYYPNWYEEKFEYKYTADVLIIGKTLQPYYIHLGAINIGYNLIPRESSTK